MYEIYWSAWYHWYGLHSWFLERWFEVKWSKRKYHISAPTSWNKFPAVHGLHTRPDILFATTNVARQVLNPTSKTTAEVYRIFKYLNGTIKLANNLDCSDISTIRAFSDADWAGPNLNRRSVSGTIVFLGNSLISWSSKGQQCATLSTMESELIALTLSCHDALWLRNLLSELTPHCKYIINLFSDNMPCLKYSSN